MNFEMFTKPRCFTRCFNVWLALLGLLCLANGATICTEQALTYPNWWLTSYAIANGITTLHIYNPAINKGSTCQWTKDRKPNQWYACESSNGSPMSIRLDQTVKSGAEVGANNNFTITQTWMCDDVPTMAPSKFEATGQVAPNQIVACKGTSTSKRSDCSTEPMLPIAGLLSSPFTLSPPANPIPLGALEPNCNQRSKAPEWEVHGFEIVSKMTWIAWGGPMFLAGDLTFLFTNKAIGFTIRCRVSSQLGLGFVRDWWPPILAEKAWPGVSCDPYVPHNYDEYKISMSWRMNPNGRQIDVKNTWYCINEPDRSLSSLPGPSLVTQYIANASFDVQYIPQPSEEPDPQCVHYQLPNKEVRCMYTNATAIATIETARGDGRGVPNDPAPLPPPEPLGCTMRSLFDSSWSLNGLEVIFNTTTDKPSRVKLIGFQHSPSGLISWGPVNSSLPADDTWHEIVFAYQSAPETVVSLAPPEGWFRFGADLVLALKITWPCEDKDTRHPIEFVATGSINLRKEDFTFSNETGRPAPGEEMRIVEVWRYSQLPMKATNVTWGNPKLSES